MINRMIKRLPYAAFINMATLYAGKTAGILVAFIFLPLYNRLLGTEQFGIVAIILSLQVLLVMLDLGLSTMISRDIAAAQSTVYQLLGLVRTAEVSLAGFYFLLLALAISFKVFGGLPNINLFIVGGAILLFWVLVMQNIYYTAMLARGAYTRATIIQIVGTIARAISSIYVLNNFTSTLTAFVLTQLFIASLHCIISRHYLKNVLCVHGEKYPKVGFSECYAMIARGRTLLISGAAGAAAMQLDKPIISIFMSAADITPYFLAVTLSATPVGILAAPVAQYFQVRITKDIAHNNHEAYKKNLSYFIIATAFAVLAPGVILFIFNENVVALWLGPGHQNHIVSSYSKILLIGYSIAAIGCIPYVIIIARQQYSFQAKLSIFATIFVLIWVAIAAYYSNITLVCYAYVAYFLIVTFGFLARMLTIDAFMKKNNVN
jgi:O-antigen/teichoic acid export membrane protein